MYHVHLPKLSIRAVEKYIKKKMYTTERMKIEKERFKHVFISEKNNTLFAFLFQLLYQTKIGKLL